MAIRQEGAVNNAENDFRSMDGTIKLPQLFPAWQLMTNKSNRDRYSYFENMKVDINGN